MIKRKKVYKNKDLRFHLTKNLEKEPAIFIDLLGNSSSCAALTYKEAYKLADFLKESANIIEIWANSLPNKYKGSLDKD